MKKIITRFAACALALLLLLLAMPATTVSAAPASLDLVDGSIVITQTGYSVAGSPETPHTDEYNITSSGTTPNTVQILDGTHNITLNAVNVVTASAPDLISESCAFSIQGVTAEVSLTLQGNNILTSSRGFAGLYVAEGAKLTIKGDGSLAVTGGGSNAYPGGAGIGGNGYIASSRFGSITINSGTVTATGGITGSSANHGAGAGIGGGGETTNYFPSAGTILITGGTVTAIGGSCTNSSETAGGAGIGSGGRNGDQLNTNDISITISGGTIAATGTSDGAGIGGGANKHSGVILIDGGVVTAIGGHEVSPANLNYGGAGIGGGDQGSADHITITGNAVVTANGGGAAAGIGGGYSGASGDIIISGNAQVTATASTSTGADRGGAGIGAGCSQAGQRQGGNISIKDSASITAYSGHDAQALGAGSKYNFSTPSHDNTLYIEDTITLNLFNSANSAPQYSVAAYPANPSGSGASLLVAYTLPTGGTFPLASTQTNTTTPDTYTWDYTGTAGNYTVTIYDNGSSLASVVSTHTTFGNGAVLLRDIAKPTVTSVTPDGANKAVSGNIEITFNEPMSSTPGTVSLDGGITTLSDGEWTTTTLFTIPYSGLDYSTTYTVSISGFKDISDNTMLDDSSHSFTTIGKAATPNAGIDFINETLTGLTGTYIINGGTPETLTGTRRIDSAWFGTTISIIAKGNGTTHVDSDAQYLTIPARRDAPTGITVRYSSLDGVSSDMEYKEAGNTGWTDANTRPAVDLRAGEYIVRYKATSSAFASMEATGFTIENPDAKAVITFEYLEGDTLIKRNRALYLLNTTLTEADLDIPTGYELVNSDFTHTVTQIETIQIEINKIDVQPPSPVYTEKPYVDGYPDGTFKPDGNITRAEVIQMLYNLLGNNAPSDLNILDKFPDMNNPHWADTPLAWAIDSGYLKGYDNGMLMPDAPISRAELSAVLHRVALKEGLLGNLETRGFSLSDISGHWAHDDITALAAKGVIEGYPDGTFKPDDAVTRAETVVMFARLFKRTQAFEDGKTFSDVPPTHWAYNYIMNAANGVFEI